MVSAAPTLQASTTSRHHEVHNLDAERSVLGACLLDAHAVPAIAARLTPNDFFPRRHQLVFRAIVSACAEFRATDPIVVGDTLKKLGLLHEAGGHELLLDLLEAVTTPAGVAHHVEIVREIAWRRRLMARCREVIERAGNGDERAALAEALRGALEDGDSPISDSLPIMSLADLGTLGNRDELVAGLIFADSLNAFCGPQKSFKTVLADRLICAIATGTEFLGHKVILPGLCIDFALEGLHGKPNRYRAQLGVDAFNDQTNRLHKRLFLSAVVPDITSIAGQDQVLRAIENVVKRTGETLRAVKYDTVARAMSVARLDESSTQDMGAWVAGLDRIRSRIPHAQLLIHHSGKNGLERGSSALPGAADLFAFVRKTGPTEAHFSVRDARDIEAPPAVLVGFEPVVVGKHPDGREVTAMRVATHRPAGSELTEDQTKSPSRTALEKLATDTGYAGFDFAQAMDVTGLAKSTTSNLLKKMRFEKFRASGEDRWRRRAP